MAYQRVALRVEHWAVPMVDWKAHLLVVQSAGQMVGGWVVLWEEPKAV